MTMPRIDTHITRGRIGINKTRGDFRMEQRHAEVEIEYETEPDASSLVVNNIRIDKLISDLAIDQTEAFADLNMRGFNDFSDHYTAKAQQDGMQAIAEIAREGDRMARIENGGDEIPRIAREKMRDDRQFNIGFIPSSPVDFEIDGSPPEIDYNPTSVTVMSDFPQIEIEASPDAIEIYLEQEPAFEIMVEGKIDYIV